MKPILATGLRAAACALSFALLAAGLAACGSTIDNRGNIPLAEAVERIEAGKQSRDDIVAMLGSPSATATFGADEAWYYIGERTSKLAFLDPELLERQVLAIDFDGSGVVARVRRYDAADGRPVEPVGRVTPTRGRELNVIQQILGNIGRFGAGEESE